MGFFVFSPVCEGLKPSLPGYGLDWSPFTGLNNIVIGSNESKWGLIDVLPFGAVGRRWGRGS